MSLHKANTQFSDLYVVFERLREQPPMISANVFSFVICTHKINKMVTSAVVKTLAYKQKPCYIHQFLKFTLLPSGFEPPTSWLVYA